MVPYTLISELTAIYTLYNVSRTGIGIVAWVASVSNRVILRKLRKYLLRRQSLVQWNPLLWNTSNQGTPPFRAHRTWKNVVKIFVFVTSIEGTPLFRGKEDFFWVPKPGFNLHSADTLKLKTWLTIKRVDKFKCTLVIMMSDFTLWTISLC